MRIVHISTYASIGGAAKAAYRIHSKLLEKGVESDMIVLQGSSQSLNRVTNIPNNLSYKIRDYFFLRLEKMLFGRRLKVDSLPFSFNFFPRISVRSHPLIKKADIICLYWVGANFLTPRQIGNLKKPIIWRFSDKWAITGNCHLSGGCTRYENHCGNCPQLTTSRQKDFTWYAWKRKFSAWKNKKITVVTPSSWMEEAVKHSPIFKNKAIVRVPTGIDHTVFAPVEKNYAKQKLNITSKKKLILFGANNPFQTLYKGSNFFIELMGRLSNEHFQFLVFGSAPNNEILELPPDIIFTGDISMEQDLAIIYNAADIFISPSTEDNLPNTVLEAMGCGTPCVAFRNSGGVVDVIDHRKNGYLAEFRNVDDLINGITWIIENNRQLEISRLARDKIVDMFTLEKQVEDLLKLYQQVLNKNHGAKY